MITCRDEANALSPNCRNRECVPAFGTSSLETDGLHRASEGLGRFGMTQLQLLVNLLRLLNDSLNVGSWRLCSVEDCREIGSLCAAKIGVFCKEKCDPRPLL